MLKGIPQILPPALLKVLCEMGHSDRIVITDGNFPAESMGKNNIVIRMDGHDVPEILDAILQVFPLDEAVERPVNLMAVAEGDTVQTPIWETYKRIVGKYDKRGENAFGQIERFTFYEETKTAYAILYTGEKSLYANVMLQKGVLQPKDYVPSGCISKVAEEEYMKTNYSKEMLEQCIQEEKKYQFDHFSHEDARKLGELLYEESLQCERSVGVEIRINGESVYRFISDDCNHENGKWLSAKANTVEMMNMSSLRVGCQLFLDGETLLNKKMNDQDYGTLGGGFPLILKGTGMIGTICVSGLWHEEDHKLIIRVLDRFING